MEASAQATALHRGSMLNRFIKTARDNAQRVYGVKTANDPLSAVLDQLSPEQLSQFVNSPPEAIQQMLPEVQQAYFGAKKKMSDAALQTQMAQRTPPDHRSPVGMAENLLNAPNANIEHWAAPIDDSNYLIHRKPAGQGITTHHVNVPGNVHDLPQSRMLIDKSTRNQAYKGLGFGALGGGALGASLGALSTSEEGDQGTNAAIGGVIGGFGGGALGAALGSGHGKELGRNAAVGSYIANQMRGLV